MVGVIVYLDKDGNKKLEYFSGMRYDEQPAEYLKRKGIEYKKIVSWYDEG